MGLREFIHAWLTSKIHDDAILFGYQVFWWARAGKLVQLISGSVILLNIIGVEKIQEAGAWIGRLITWQTIFSMPNAIKRRLTILGIDWELWNTNEIPRYLPVETDSDMHFIDTSKSPRELNPEYSEEKNALIKARIHELNKQKRALKGNKILDGLIYIPGIIACIWSCLLIHSWDVMSVKWLLWLATAALIFFIANLVVAFLVAIVLRIPLLLIDLLVITPIARLLSIKELERFALALSFVLLVLGSLVDIALS